MQPHTATNRFSLSNQRQAILTFCLIVFAAKANCLPDEDFQPDRCEILPLSDQQVSMRIDGIEKLRWNFGEQYLRPFFFPFNGPSGIS